MKEETLFHLATLQPPERRGAFLEAACAGDREALARLEILLQANARAGNFLMEPPFAGGIRPEASATPDPSGGSPSIRVGPYKLLHRIGEGGMGEVYLAEQTHPVRREVALKIIKPGMDSRQVIARFEAERQALALMDHPNIAKVLDAGTTESQRPYFVMELVRGLPITQHCDEHKLSLRERLDLFASVCQAVQHAHQKGIIHRDLKPSNVLVAPYDGHPVPKVIDFGVAKATGPSLTERTLFTAFGAVVGTLEYMSPEQAELNQLDVDSRSDVYSLGVMLYELLTGSTPVESSRLKQAAMSEALRIIREEEPPKPSTRLGTTVELAAIAVKRGLEPQRLSGLVRGELDWIVMKCLEKDRDRRYETAASLAEDVRAYLVDEPVRACPPSAGYRFRKFARRNRRAFAMLAMVALALFSIVFSLAASTLLVWREKNRTQAANVRLKENLELALETLDEIYLEVAAEELPRGSEGRASQLELLRKALDFYRRFAEQNSSEPDVERAQARAFWRAGQIHLLLDDSVSAQEAQGRSMELYRDLLAADPKDATARFGLASCLIDSALLEYRTGRHQEAERHDLEGLQLIEGLIDDGVADLGYFNELARTLSNLGVLLQALQRFSEAEAVLVRASELYDKLLIELPGEPDVELGRARARINLGLVQSVTERPAEAERAYRESIAALERSTHDAAREGEWRRAHAVAHSNLGVLLRAQERYLEAEAAYREAVEVQEGLVADFPSVPEYVADLALSYLNLGVAVAPLGRLEEAEEAHRTSLVLLDELTAQFPGVPAYRRDQGLNHYTLGVLYGTTGRLEESLSSCDRAVRIQADLVARHPDVPDYQREFALSHDLRAHDLLQLDRHAESADAARRGRELHEDLLSRFPAAIACRQELAQALSERARLLRAAGRPADAQEPSLRALELWDELTVARPEDSLYRTHLGAHLDERARLLRSAGELEPACRLLERAIAMQQASPARGAGSDTERESLRRHCSELADIRLLMADHGAAASAAEQLASVRAEHHEDCERAAVLFLRCVHLAEEDARLAPPQRESVLRTYADRAEALLEEAERRRASAAEVEGTAGGGLTIDELYDIASAYAWAAGSRSEDDPRTEERAARAVERLGRALELGFADRERVLSDADFEPLRARPDFRSLFAEAR